MAQAKQSKAKKVGRPRVKPAMPAKDKVAVLMPKVTRKTNVAVPRSRKSRTPGVYIKNDISLSWASEKYPELEQWRQYAVEWLQSVDRGLEPRLQALRSFFVKYMVEMKLPTDPAALLSRATQVPDIYGTAIPATHNGVKENNHVREFIGWVLLRHFSEPDDFGRPMVIAAFHNPVAHRSSTRTMRPEETVRSPLPYGYIEELRSMLAQGPNFRDWTFAQNALGAKPGTKGALGPDWFDVNPEDIDPDDPDCVWRTVHMVKRGKVLQMWSPVRWVALLVKLILPLRTFQVRMLDSGEADTWRFEKGQWSRNRHLLKDGTERLPVQNGVLRRPAQTLTSAAGTSAGPSVVLYINTNKTADALESGPNKGYVLPWVDQGPVHSNPFYWLEKLRNWQEKYNPVDRRTKWSELDGRHIGAKTAVQLSSYPDSCFLFRTRELQPSERHLPLYAQALDSPWWHLLGALEDRLAARSETNADGSRIHLVSRAEKSNTTEFPLHALRVSLVTALAIEGELPFPILQKLVGHSRVLMTLYYTKPGLLHYLDELRLAEKRLTARRDSSVTGFLLNAEYENLVSHAISNSPEGLGIAIPEHPASRNAAGWMPMHHGLCLVGGNTTPDASSARIGGCYNGGSVIGRSGDVYHGPVPGGARNCVRCRWFVTEPHYLPALVAHFNVLMYHFDEARNQCLSAHQALDQLKDNRLEAEEAGRPFEQGNDLREAERIWEAAMKRFSDLAEDARACWNLIERCRKALEPKSDKRKRSLVAAGSEQDVRLAIEEVDSELLQLSEVCEATEVLPDLQPGKAVFRRSQLLDAALLRDGLPPVFMTLSEDEQLRAGNAFMQALARSHNPQNPVLGKRSVVAMMDANERLGERLGLDMRRTLTDAIGPSRVPMLRPQGALRQVESQ